MKSSTTTGHWQSRGRGRGRRGRRGRRREGEEGEGEGGEEDVERMGYGREDVGKMREEVGMGRRMGKMRAYGRRELIVKT